MKFSSLSLAALLSSASAFTTAPPAFVAQSRGIVLSSTALDASRKPFISGNWKLNPQTKQEATDLAKGIADAIGSDSPDSDVALFVPYVFIETAMEATGGKIEIGAEVRPFDFFWAPLLHFDFFWLRCYISFLGCPWLELSVRFVDFDIVLS